MPDPLTQQLAAKIAQRKEAAENLSRRAAEGEESFTSKRQPPGTIEHAREITLDDLTGKGRRTVEDAEGKDARYRFDWYNMTYSTKSGKGPQGKRNPELKNWMEFALMQSLAKKGFIGKGTKRPGPGSLSSLKSSGEWMSMLVNAGLVKSSLIPKESARLRAARKVSRKKRLIGEARQRPLKDVATKDMTAKERREWSKRQKK